MNRLRDESGLDPISEKGIEMLRSVRPTSCPPGLKRRVWATLQQTPGAAPNRSRFSALRVLVVGIGLLVFTATAAATIGGRRIAAQIERLFGARVGAVQPRSERSKPLRVAAEAQRSPAPAILPAISQPGGSETPAPREDRTSLGETPAPPAAHGASRPARSVPLASETSRERAQVWEALVALRRDHDPDRAAALLNHELEANPHGVLRQEALVLAIEAADARGDRRGAESFARAYQREFPSGRFKQWAQRYLGEKNARLRALPSKQ